MEIVLPLLPPFLEELSSHGSIDVKSFVAYHVQFWLAPAIAVPFTIGYCFFSLRGSDQAEALSQGGLQGQTILNLANIRQDELTYQTWNIVGAIYGQVCVLTMLPYLCEVRKEHAKAEH